VYQTYLQAKCAAGVVIQQTMTPNYASDAANVDEVKISPKGTRTRDLFKFDHAQLQDVDAFQVTLGDKQAVSNNWTLDGWIGRYRKGEPK